MTEVYYALVYNKEMQFEMNTDNWPAFPFRSHSRNERAQWILEQLMFKMADGAARAT